MMTTTYIVAHLAAAAACVGLIVSVPLIAMLIVSITSGDPGGLMFWPIFFLFLLVGGLAIAATFSLVTLTADWLRQRHHLALWIPPAFVFIVVPTVIAIASHGQGAIIVYLGLGAAAALAFSFYWFAVSSLWFLPRLLARLFGIHLPQPLTPNHPKA